MRDKVVKKVEEEIVKLLASHMAKHLERAGLSDEAWYWVALE